MIRVEFIQWFIERPGTGQEINRTGICIKCASNVFCTNPVSELNQITQVDTIACHFKNREWFWGKVYRNIVLTAFEEGRLSE